MRYTLKERALFEVLKEAVEQLSYTVDDIDNVPYNCLIREAKLVITIVNKTGEVSIREEVIPIGTYASVVSGYANTVDARSANKLVEELELAVDALECQFEDYQQ